ncbi:DUF169 domain-containing protein [Archaeoglobus neptunius]|uniref:DUF169 domain-containing protein n=1 Tax=Archaeoglobus neptunius TaxID=2798580 RepID=UPI0019269610|nr:DUF169 domain-containing protein [Archaeoglobus neptunius]
MNCSELAVEIERYIRPQTFPLGFKLVKSEEEIGRARRFDGLTICQIYNMARRYRWVVYFDLNTTCPVGIIAYGFADPDDLYLSGQLAYDAGYVDSPETGVRYEEALPKLERNYIGCRVSPLEICEDEPDFVVVYGMPAQILRFVHATLYKKGGGFETIIRGRGACAELLDAFISGEPRLVIPCYGDRLFGQTQDFEIAFSFPFKMADEIVEGLRETHRRGIRYPIPSTGLRVGLPVPGSYEESVKKMKAKTQERRS